MIARCVVRFFDKEKNTMREPGDEFQVSASRFEAINATKYGKLAEAIETASEKPSEPEPIENADAVETEPENEPERPRRGRGGYRS